MISVLISIVLTAQFNGPPNLPMKIGEPHPFLKTPYTLDDLAFDRAQEDFVIDYALENAKSQKKRLYYFSCMPEDVREFAMDLTDDCQKCRTRALKGLKDMGRPVVRWMFWVSRSEHSEAAALARKVVWDVLKCKACDGTGQCQEFTPKPNDDDGLCLNCDWFSANHSYYTDNGRADCLYCYRFGICGKP